MPEEIKKGVFVCENCNNDLNPADMTKEADIYDFSECSDLVPDTNAQYENSQCASADCQPSYEFGAR